MHWLGWQAFELWLVQKLVRSHYFNKAVRRIHRTVEEARRGEKLHDPEDFSNLDINNPKQAKMESFVKHFKDELRDQFRGQTKK